MASVHQTRPSIPCATSVGLSQRNVWSGILGYGTWWLLRPDHPGFHSLWRPSWTACGLVHKRFETKIIFFTNISFKQNLRQLMPWRLSLPAGFCSLKYGLSFASASCIQTLSLILAQGCLNIQKNVLDIKRLPYYAIVRTIIFLIPQKNRDSSRKIPARWDLGIHWRWLHIGTDWRKNGN